MLDRADAVDGAGPLELVDLGVGLARGIGWNVLVAGLAVWGIVTLYRSTSRDAGRWKPVLVAGLALVPLVAVLVGGVALPVYPREALAVCAGGAALAAGIGLMAIPDRSHRIAAAVATSIVAVAALAAGALREGPEDWRSATELVRREATPRGTVVVLPARARAAFAYYAPEIRTSLAGRGDEVVVVVAGDPSEAHDSGARRRLTAPVRVAVARACRERSRRAALGPPAVEVSPLRGQAASLPDTDRRARTPRRAAGGRRRCAGRARSRGAGSVPNPGVARLAGGLARS